MRRPLYLQRGNAKLGVSIWTWSIPAVTGCGPAPSEYCERSCYAIAFRRFPSAMQAHERNHELALDADVLRVELRLDLRSLPPGSVIRVHVAGDFFAVPYARVWRDLFREFPGLTFYAYTRSWTDPALRRTLIAMQHAPNVRLWASSDWTMQAPPPNWLEARVFRSIDDARAAGYAVCPEQLGAKASCEHCQLCWRVAPDSRFRLAFIDHGLLHRAGEGKHSSPAH